MQLYYRSAKRNRSSAAIIFLTLLIFTAICDTRGSAGLSSENVVVVVNGDSLASRTVANHYIDFRQIPTRNVIVLDAIPEDTIVDLETFREQILRPVLTQLDERKLAATVRVIAYSVGFPTGVRISEHTKQLEDETAKKYQLPTASITGLTYFYRYVLSDNPAYLSFGSNLYARGRFERHFVNPFSGELKQKFNRAEELMEEQKFAESAILWREIVETHPAMSATAIRAAEAYSLADQDLQAVEMVRAAIKGGWWSASYLRDTPALEKHLDEPSIAKAMTLLDTSPTAWQGPESFSGNVGWAINGARVDLKKGGIPYLCSCTLGVVAPHGSTLSQAVRVLRRASLSDRTFPTGRFAFGASSDVRSKTRFPNIANTIGYLQDLKYDTEIFKTALPTKPGAILGMMVGTANAKPNPGEWIMVRGAIADNLTSLGGAFHTPSQTKLTAFLHAGAAMSSGAVAEPYSLHMKFPSPMLYGYYAKGLSAIESFYQSVLSPYQLLIVGDPLAQPFARAPDEVVDIEFENEPKPKLRIDRRSLGLKVPKTPTRAIELSIDGRLVKKTRAVASINVNWPDDTSGIYDIRVTLVGLDRTEPRSTFVSEVDVQGKFPTPTATITEPRTGADGYGNDGSTASAVVVEVHCKGADTIELECLGDSVAVAEPDDNGHATLTIATDNLGGGPLRFHPIASFGKTRVRGKTLVTQFDESK